MPPHHSVESFAQAIRAIGEPIHNRTAEEISMAKLLMLLFEVTGLFDMRTRPELLLLQKTMVVVEGVARSLDPKLDMWTDAEPVVREWIERHLGPAGRIEGRGRGRGRDRPFPRRVPGLLARGAALVEQLDAITRDGLVLAPETVAAIGRAEARRNRWTTLALWVDRRRCWRWLVYLRIALQLASDMIALIAMQSSDSLSQTSSHGQPHHPPARRGREERLRLRAAQNGRSMEDEARTILRQAAAPRARPRATAAAPSRAARPQRRAAAHPAVPARSACC